MTNDPVELAYAAGFLDGEGCVAITKRKRGKSAIEYALRVTIGNTDYATLEWYAQKFGGRVGNERAGVNKPLKYWTVSNKQAYEFLKVVFPYLKGKAPQADVAIRATEALRGIPRVGFGRGSNPEIYAAWEAAKEEMHALKRR